MEIAEAVNRPHQMDLLNTAEAAAYLRMSASKLNKDRANGQGPRFIRLGAKVFYRKADLEEYLTAGIVETSETRSE